MVRRPIQQLSASLVNRIAAGEVIERPAAVVKELVENALDAGSSQIIVEVEDGGRALIRVIDDGGGIPPGELPLAFASHATSKLTCDDDLFRIGTMGFRGEALASIGAVSHARILSRTEGSDAAWEIHNRGGVISDAQAAAGNRGTTIEVRNLFYNTPARRKFIKGSSTEFGHISEAVLRIALPHPQVGFRLLHNGRVSLDLPATDPESRLLEAWPAEFHEQRLPVEVRDAELKLRGVIGLPELARPTARYQYLFLNGRSIRDRFIQHALREAYRGLTEPGRHPAGILLLEVPPGDVDVNVHPTKTEVRFRDSGRIHGLVLSAVREKLLGSDLAPSAVPMRSDAEDVPRAAMRERIADFFKSQFTPEAMQPAVQQPTLPMGDGTSRAPFQDPGAWREKTNEEWRTENGERRMGQPILHSPFSVLHSPLHGSSEAPSAIPAPPSHPGPVQPSGDGGVKAIQLHNAYLVAETPEGMVIIDQHALHERIMYEDLRLRVSRGTLESQRLLIPQVVDASSSQLALLDQLQPLLRRLGIEVAPIGPGTVAVHSFPSFLEKLEPGGFVRELLERGEQELLDLHEEELLHEVMDMMACKAAVKAGDSLTGAEIEALLARRELIDRSSNCPHGRPTTLRLSLRDLEKQFKRTGF